HYEISETPDKAFSLVVKCLSGVTYLWVGFHKKRFDEIILHPYSWHPESSSDGSEVSYPCQVLQHL
ncbi:MAG: hypothetical protein AAFP92_23215, partial [Bacteroidota bacterium]